MEKASFLMRLRFSYTVVLLEVFAGGLRKRYHSQRKSTLHGANAA